MRISNQINTLSELREEINKIDLELKMNEQAIGQTLQHLQYESTAAFKSSWVNVASNGIKLLPSLLTSTKTISKRSIWSMLIPLASKYLNKYM